MLQALLLECMRRMARDLNRIKCNRSREPCHYRRPSETENVVRDTNRILMTTVSSLLNSETEISYRVAVSETNTCIYRIPRANEFNCNYILMYVCQEIKVRRTVIAISVFSNLQCVENLEWWLDIEVIFLNEFNSMTQFT